MQSPKLLFHRLKTDAETVVTGETHAIIPSGIVIDTVIYDITQLYIIKNIKY